MIFSIIVPVYNIESYLPTCIESVLAQKYTGYELILVDDGSLDNSGRICDYYSELYKQVKVVHKKNGGPSEARNIGLEHSLGKYIIFLDGDDTLKSDILMKIFSIVKEDKYDAIFGSRTNWYPNQKNINYDYSQLQNSQVTTIKSLLEQFAIRRMQFPWAPYETIYNRNFLIGTNVKFNVENIGAEDAEFFFDIITYVQKFKVTNLSFVNYRLSREGSTDNTKNYRTVINQLSTFKNAYNNCGDFGSFEIMRKYFANHYTNIVVQAALIKNMEDRKKCLNYIKKNDEIIKASKGVKYSLAKMVWNIFGYYVGSKIIWKLRFSGIRKRIHFL